jgi:formylglycine-generating enzyme required for sulfatase activity
MLDPPESQDPSSSADSVYDAYLEAALAGDAQEPAAFLARFPGLTDDEHDELIERLRAIGALVVPAARPDFLKDDASGETLGQIGEYRLLRRLGGGAMGDVFLAEQTSLGRLVALKTQRADLAASPKAMARFEREAQALAQVAHPSVVGVHGFGREGELRYLVMELLPGRSLKELLDEPRAGEAPPTSVQVARWGVELAKGLQAVHQAGLLHRDVKPSNVRISETGHAVLVDFGLARLSTASELSRPGEFVGSPAYAAPEQVQGVSDLDARADVYGLGATLYHALAGRPPFVGEGIESVLHGVLHRDPPALRSLNPNLPRDLELVCAKALEKARERRYASAEAFAMDLKAVLELRPVSAKPIGWTGRALRWSRRNASAASSMVLALLTVLAALIVLGWTRHRAEVERLDTAASYVEDARGAIENYRTERLALVAEEADYDELYKLQEYMHLSGEQVERMRTLEDGVRSARERRDDAYRTVGNLLDQALELDPSLGAEINAVWSSLLIERIVEAEDRGDVASRDFFASEIARRDPDGSVRAAAYPFAQVQVRVADPETRVWLFRSTELDDLPAGSAFDEVREVPVPILASETQQASGLGFQPPTAWGAVVLRVQSGAGALEPGDVILSVDGHSMESGALVDVAGSMPGVQVGDRLIACDGVRVRDSWDVELELSVDQDRVRVLTFARDDQVFDVELPPGSEIGMGVLDLWSWAERGGALAVVYSRGEVRELRLPAGLVLRPTAAPIYLDPQYALDLNHKLSLEPGRYLLVAQEPGHAPRRYFISPKKGAEHTIEMPAAAEFEVPAGLVPVRSLLHNMDTIYMGESEVTSLEYLAFLNDPETLRTVDAEAENGRHVYFPRSGTNIGAWGMWEREESGAFRLPGDWPPNWPVLGVSYRDALAFCAWRSANAPGTFRLPDSFEFYIGGTGANDRAFSWGNRFDQRFATTCFARRLARPAPVMGSPRDESPYGLYDTCGNTLEWLENWFDETRGLRTAAGGAWGQARVRDLSIVSERGLNEDVSGGETGFRIAWEPQ